MLFLVFEFHIISAVVSTKTQVLDCHVNFQRNKSNSTLPKAILIYFILASSSKHHFSWLDHFVCLVWSKTCFQHHLLTSYICQQEDLFPFWLLTPESDPAHFPSIVSCYTRHQWCRASVRQTLGERERERLTDRQQTGCSCLAGTEPWWQVDEPEINESGRA